MKCHTLLPDLLHLVVWLWGKLVRPLRPWGHIAWSHPPVTWPQGMRLWIHLGHLGLVAKLLMQRLWGHLWILNQARLLGNLGKQAGFFVHPGKQARLLGNLGEQAGFLGHPAKQARLLGNLGKISLLLLGYLGNLGIVAMMLGHLTMLPQWLLGNLGLLFSLGKEAMLLGHLAMLLVGYLGKVAVWFLGLVLGL